MSIIDQLGGEKIPGAFSKDSPVGATVTGTIVKAEIMQMRDFATGQPETWEDGNPKNQVRIVLDVNGDQQAVYVKTWGINAQNLKDAVQAAGMSDLDRGATLTVTFDHEEPSDNPRFNPAKIYTFALKPASGTAGIFTQPAVPATEAAPAGQAPAAQGGNVIDEVKQLHASGLTPEQIHAAIGQRLPLDAIAAVLAA